jgi:hypothetical protein
MVHHVILQQPYLHVKLSEGLVGEHLSKCVCDDQIMVHHVILQQPYLHVKLSEGLVRRLEEDRIFLVMVLLHLHFNEEQHKQFAMILQIVMVLLHKQLAMILKNLTRVHHNDERVLLLLRLEIRVMMCQEMVVMRVVSWLWLLVVVMVCLSLEKNAKIETLRVVMDVVQHVFKKLCLLLLVME